MIAKAAISCLLFAVMFAGALAACSGGNCGPDPVRVTLYMESLCPGCQALFASQFFPTWQKLNTTGILTVDVVPYGNAKEEQQDNKWVFTCQHGANECVGNQFETCAVNLLVAPEKWMPYLHCIELKLQSGGQDVPQIAKDCAAQFNISFDAISQCTLSAQGNVWEHFMAQRTETLDPPHQYVPWITVNGVHTDAIQQQAETNMLQLVCQTYMGQLPKECSQFAAVERCPRV